MSEYSKRLHIRKDGTVQDINLYTTTSDISSGQYLRLRDGSTLLYAALGSTTDSSASSLRVRKSGTIYAVLKESYPTGSVTYTTNIFPKKEVTKHTGDIRQNKWYTLALPTGTKKIKVEGYYDNSLWEHKYLDVNGISTLYIYVNRIDGFDSDNEKTWSCDANIYKEQNLRSKELFYIYNNKRQCSLTISWSPTINNS